MHSSTIFTIFATVFAATVMARPQGGELTVDQATQQCGNGQIIACCNTASMDGDDILGLNQLLGGNCSPLQVPGTLLLSDPAACGSNSAACCQGNDQTGVINVQASCSPIDLA